MNMNSTVSPLANLRIVELAWWIAAPQATNQLAMLGADVIRLESIRRADGMRMTTPYPDGISGINRSGRWISHNYSKRSVSLDLSKPEAQAIALRLIQASDVVVENLSTGTMERLGMDYPMVRSVKPDIIYCTVSAVGREGPHREYIGMGPTVAAYSGLSALTGRPGGPPGAVEPFISDYVTAWHLALGIVAAVHERNRTGAGKYVEIAMIDAQLSQLPDPIIDASMNGRRPQAMGNLHPTMAPHGCYPCLGDDRWLAITVATDDQWCSLCQVVRKQEYASDERYSDGLARHRHREEIDELIAAWTRDKDAFELQRTLQAVGVPAAVEMRPEDIYNDPHLKERDAFISPKHPEAGSYPMAGLTWNFSRSAKRIEPPPLLGEDNDDVLRGLLGLSDDEIASLEAASVLA